MRNFAAREPLPHHTINRRSNGRGMTEYPAPSGRLFQLLRESLGPTTSPDCYIETVSPLATPQGIHATKPTKYKGLYSYASKRVIQPLAHSPYIIDYSHICNILAAILDQCRRYQYDLLNACGVAMKIDTLIFGSGSWSPKHQEIPSSRQAAIVFLFGDSDILKQEHTIASLQALYPQAHIVGASSSGNILGAEIPKADAVATVVSFSTASVQVAKTEVAAGDDIKESTRRLINALPQQGLRHVFLLSDGLNINGSRLSEGANSVPGSFTVSGGMAGDGDRFQETWTIANGEARQNQIVAIGFYGNSITTSTSYCGGWSSFGADRLVTRSEANILYELDGQPALDLYKEYLGQFASELPYSGMRFPLSIRHDNDADEVIRTLLGVDDEKKSITFAGDIPEGYIARLMKPNINQLVDGSTVAAKRITQHAGHRGLGLVVSCVGRRVVMKDLVEEELEGVAEVLGPDVQLVGFYSYGEIAPFGNQPRQCQLHNQTMTLTVLYEE